MTEQELFVSFLEQEFPINLKVMKAIPPEQSDYKPHERSSSAKQIVLTMVSEMTGFVKAAQGEEQTFIPVEAPTVSDAIAIYEKAYADGISIIKNMPEGEMEKNTTGAFASFFPKRRDLMWMFLFDSIHHRGQLSVYIRLAGGKVPAIYGPSADDNPFAPAGA